MPHPKIVKLQLGYLEPIAQMPAEVPTTMDRRVLLVYTGSFESMNGLVEVKDEHVERLAAVRNGLLGKAKRLASGDLPVHLCPPVQLDHSPSARDTVGRVVGDYEIGWHEPEPGDRRKALYTTMRFLGRENVEKAMDGRYNHVSIGADLEKGSTQEISVTPFPAAPDAQLLSRIHTEEYKGYKIIVTRENGEAYYYTIEGKPEKHGPLQKLDDAIEQARQAVEGCITSHNLSKGDQMNLKRLSSYLQRVLKLSAEDADKKLGEKGKSFDEWAEEEKKEHEKFKKYLTGHRKMSEEDADKHLSEMDVNKKKELSAEVDEHEKKLAKEHEDAHKAKMTAARASLTKLSTDFRAGVAGAQLAQKKAGIVSRLSRLKAEAKITPAEIKKIDLDQLAASTEATVDAVLKSYQDREPVIAAGIIGSRQGTNVSAAAKQTKLSALEAETRANMPFMAQVAKNRLAADGEKKKPEHSVADGEPVHHAEMSEEEAKEAHKMAAHHLTNVHAALDAGKMDEAKQHLKHLMDHVMKHMRHPAHMSDGDHEKHESQMSALASNVKTMQDRYEDLHKLVESLVGSGT